MSVPVLLGVAALAASCRAPTEITLVVTTDVKCADLRGTSITVGRLGEVETKAPTTSSTFCDASGDLGVLVIVPSGGNGDDVAMKVVAGLGRDAESCVPPYGKGCIVARRAVRYLAHTGLRIAVPLRAACDGVPCGETETCVSGTCAGATIADSSQCSGPTGCGEQALGPASAVDGGADGGADGSVDAGVDAGPVGPLTYHDMTDPSFWSTFDLTTVKPGASGFTGAAFDGRYVHFVPYSNGGAGGGVVARYDTQAPFPATASWSTFDMTTVNAGAFGYEGAAFDGRYIHFAPMHHGAPANGLVVHYDTQAPFATGTSWTTFDTTTLNASAAAYCGAAFDGRHVYFVPSENSLVTRYDTQAPFAAGASWSTFDTTTAIATARGYYGAVFDGRYVYFVPNLSGSLYGVILRYDTQASFATATSWSTFDAQTVHPNARGFHGAGFDGRYVYFVPGQFFGLVVRYDTQAPFATGASWSTFDMTTLKANAVGFQGAGFDGRYMYFVPWFNQSAYDGLVVRYDTQAPFATGASWSTFDMATVNPGATGFLGAAFDGRYMYFVPNGGGVVARFDAKTPPSMPKLPGFNGSFL